MSPFLCILTALTAHADPARPTLPGWSTAGDDGAAALWSNIANIGLDPDPSWYAQASSALQTTPGALARSFALAGNSGPLATGLSWSGGTDGPEWWSLSTGLGLRLDRGLSIGGRFAWQLPEGAENNFATGDLGITWRPISWLGLAGVAQNMGSGEKGSGVLEPRVGPALALRPWEDRILLGVDWTMPSNRPEDGLARATLRIRPLEAMMIRLAGDQNGMVTVGVEVFQGRAGLGAHAIADTAAFGDSVLGVVSARTSPDRAASLGGGPRIANFELDGSYPYRNPTGFLAPAPQETWLGLLGRLRLASTDPRVEGVLVHLQRAPGSLAKLEEARAELLRIKENGKKVVVYLDGSASNGTYYLASAADLVVLHPAGELELIGLSAESMYLRGLLDRLGVEPQFAKRSAYKSAPETFTNTEGSSAAREQLNAMLDDLSAVWTEGIGTARSRDAEEVGRLVDGGPYTAEEAKEAGLVDRLAYPDELEGLLEEEFGKRPRMDEAYARSRDTRGWRNPREIAVVVVDGAIVRGRSRGPGFFGGGFTSGADTIVDQLDEARERLAVKAVVLRVDSPGGSAFASDEIWRAVRRLEKAGKPVIVSMGSVAASGGYYVSAGGRAIFAQPSTITGSIGVYAGPFLDMSDLFDKVGLNTELYTRGRKAGMYSTSKPLDAVEFDALDHMVGATYAQFKDRVATGRKLSPDDVEAVAQGRVWTGVRAQRQGLVDEFGGFHDALERARHEADIPEKAEVDVVIYRRLGGPGSAMVARPVGLEAPSPPLARLARHVGIQAPASPLEELGRVPGAELLQTWAALEEERVWAIMPLAIEVE